MWRIPDSEVSRASYLTFSWEFHDNTTAVVAVINLSNIIKIVSARLVKLNLYKEQEQKWYSDRLTEWHDKRFLSIFLNKWGQAIPSLSVSPGIPPRQQRWREDRVRYEEHHYNLMSIEGKSLSIMFLLLIIKQVASLARKVISYQNLKLRSWKDLPGTFRDHH